MWRLTLCALGLLVSPPLAGHAADQKFPYEAVVVADQVQVRCGPGFYVTSYVNQNDTVTVHRHDHGGWYMIAPPPGSFSWIPASSVKKISDKRGVIDVPPETAPENRAILHIGSQVSDNRSCLGRELSNGEEVTLLGEETFSTPEGVLRMFKIAPPAQQFRWLKGNFVVPVNEQLRRQIAVDPYEVPPEHRKQVAMASLTESPPPLLDPPRRAPAPDDTVNTLATTRQVAFENLDKIDAVYSQMMSQDPSQWQLDQLERQYNALQGTADSTISALIDQRLEIIGRRREILNHYRDFVELAAQTSQRDAALAAMQSSYEVVAPVDAWPPGVELGLPGHSATDPHVGSSVPYNPSAAGFPQPNSFTPPGTLRAGTIRERSANDSMEASDGSPVAPRLNGAGIIQPLNRFPGTPAFALIAPGGRLLAYLDPAGDVRLGEWIGKESGVIGQRFFDPQLGTDVIRVKQILPVRLTQ